MTEAAQLDAVLNLRDARSLRLGALRDAVLPLLKGNDSAVELFELNLQDGEKPRLWIDLISAVEMEPDPKTYRLVQQRDGARETLLETAQLDEMRDYLVRFLAHRVVAQERHAAGLSHLLKPGKRGYSLFALVYAWFTGLMFGVLSLVAWALAVGRLKF
ncbi:MAG: hypothetical protein KGO53_08285 [Alphaproteobacteria bacterium]|nr:hypothetical protein [Alphaproteobacteria bacterium]